MDILFIIIWIILIILWKILSGKYIWLLEQEIDLDLKKWENFIDKEKRELIFKAWIYFWISGIYYKVWVIFVFLWIILIFL